MEQQLRILFLEDAPTDIEIIERELRNGGLAFVSAYADSKEKFLTALEEFNPTIILADFSLPDFDGLSALSLVRERDLDIPFIFVSGTMGEENAIDTMLHGATDYVLKQRLNRLVTSVRHALSEAQVKKEKHEIEKSLAREQMLLDKILETNPSGILSINRNGDILFMNPKARELLDIHRETDIPIHISALHWDMIDTNGHPIPVEGLPYAIVMDSGRPVYDFIASRTRDDGSNVILSINCTLLHNGDTGHDGVVCTLNDITQLHMTQMYKELSIDILNLLNKVPHKEDVVRNILLLVKERTGIEAIGLRLHKDGDYPYYTTNGFPEVFVEKEKSLCMTDDTGNRIADPDGAPLLECMCGNVIQKRTDPDKPYFTAHGSFWTNSTTELLAHTSQEELKTITRNRCNNAGFESVALIPLFTDEGVIGLLQLNDTRKDRFTPEMVSFFEGIAVSIALAMNRKDAEYQLQDHADNLEQRVRERTRELEQAQEELVRKERLAALGKLAGGMSHELRNPLGAIKNAGYFLNLAMTEDDPEIRESIKIVMKETDTAERIIGSMLDFARPRQPEREKVDIDQLIDATIEGCSIPELIKIIRERGDNIPQVSVDSVQISRVFANLINNAVQAISGPGSIRITTMRAESDMVRISVRDSGAGISEEHMKKMFEPLFTTKAKGIGLGLAISKTLLERHGGTISVTSTLGKGSEFTILLPVTGQKAVDNG